MASNDNDRRPTDDKASIALLRRIRAGEHVDFVHGVDVCDAAPEILVANLEPVPGYSSVWYLYCAKKYTNKRGQLSGYRERAITGGGGASWHPEIGRKNVQGSGGGTFCTFTYGRKHKTEERSTRSVVVVNRLGWKMVEYDDLAEADAASNYVLCKVYRTALAKGKSSLPSSSSSGQNENASSSSSKPPTAKKRKACGGDHPEAAPASKLIQQHAQQVEEKACGGDHPEAAPASKLIQQQQVEELNVEDYDIDIMEMLPDVLSGEPVPELGMQQPTDARTEHDGRFNIVEELKMLPDEPVAEPGIQQPTDAETEHDVRFKVCCSSEHGHGSGSSFSMSIEEELNVDDYDIDIMEMMPDVLSGEPVPEPGMQQPTDARTEHDGRFNIVEELKMLPDEPVAEPGIQQPTDAETEHNVRFKVCCSSSEHGHGSGSSFSINIEEELNVDDYDIDIMEMMPDEPDHPEATPASLIQQQEADVQQHGHKHGVGFHFEGMQQPTNVAEPEHDDSRSIHPMSGDPLLAAQVSFDFEGMQQPTIVAESEHDDGRSVHPLSGGPVLADQVSFDFEGMQQPTTVVEPEHDDDWSMSIQLPRMCSQWRSQKFLEAWAILKDHMM
ncbi:Putative NAC domain transcription factor superfamily protein [Zea mays]|uniref:Putative NAC domain transcription factor superfamily protein n=1 Tax=Zea mays TaxID=4577 RepID=K7V7J3_MAIZE|nr:Putative NAC domain transcription factor superfamily protein [Zea mays]